MAQVANLKESVVKRIALTLAVFAVMVCISSCSSAPNDKLEIDGKEYTISLGSITYDAAEGIATIEVLADGKPLPNTKSYQNSSMTIDEQQVSSSTYVSQPVKMALLNGGILIPASDTISSREDGVFVFAVDKAPEKIQIFTGGTDKESVYFDGKTKTALTSEEFYPSVQGQE